MYCTEMKTLKARKPHRCMSCGDPIEKGETYYRWACFDDGTGSTIKMHPECHAGHCDLNGSGSWEFSPYDHERGSAELR